MNMLKGDKQGVFMIPFATTSGISYGDRFLYDAAGQLWRWGGNSNNGSNCGLAYTNSNNVWSNSNTNIGARLTLFRNKNYKGVGSASYENTRPQ